MNRRPVSCIPQPPRVRIVREVLESAKDVRDEMVVAACRRLLWANTLGWRKHARPADKKLVFEIADFLREARACQ